MKTTDTYQANLCDDNAGSKSRSILWTIVATLLALSMTGIFLFGFASPTASAEAGGSEGEPAMKSSIELFYEAADRISQQKMMEGAPASANPASKNSKTAEIAKGELPKVESKAATATKPEHAGAQPTESGNQTSRSTAAPVIADIATSEAEEGSRIVEEPALQAQTASLECSIEGAEEDADDAIWEPSFVTDESGALGDSLIEWRPNYFIAHNLTTDGQVIASTPELVSIRGILYRFVSSAVGTFDTVEDDFNYWKDFVYENDGIGFQTCLGPDQFLVAHYEPAI